MDRVNFMDDLQLKTKGRNQCAPCDVGLRTLTSTSRAAGFGLAARAGGFHYRHDGTAWMDTKGQGEFLAHLSRFASEQSGQSLDFSF